MAYVYTPQRPQRSTALAKVARPNVPVRVIPAPAVGIRPKAQRGRVVRLKARYESTGTNLGEYLGILPAVVAAAPSVEKLAQKALNSVIGIVDQGKKRDANRQARADFWGNLALNGSITAARRVLGGSKLQYTPKERQYYIDYWQKLMQAKPALAQQAITLGALGVPEPGSDIAPPSIPTEDQASLQREVDAYNAAVQTGATLPGPGAMKALPPGNTMASLGPLIGIAIGGALLRKVF